MTWGLFFQLAALIVLYGIVRGLLAWAVPAITIRTMQREAARILKEVRR